MELHNEIVIDRPAAAVWQVLAERYADVSEWAAPITESHCSAGGDSPEVGTVRACAIAGFGPVQPGVVKEQLVTLDRARLVCEYIAVAGMPRFVAHAMNRWSVHPVDATSCRVRIHATVRLRGLMVILAWPFKWQMQSAGSKVAEELKHFVERGAPHPRKLAARRPG
jgi:hypothetical protein